MNQITHSAAILELERAFNFFNEKLFKNNLTPLVITIQAQGKTRARGWYCAGSWSDIKDDKSTAELNICAELLVELEQIPFTLIHELVHHHNRINEIQDCSRDGRYHNTRFKKSAEAVGFEVLKSTSGWNVTKPKQDLIDLVEEFKMNNSAFSHYRKKESNAKKQGQKKVMWKCDCMKIWAKEEDELKIHCDFCNTDFARKESD